MTRTSWKLAGLGALTMTIVLTWPEARGQAQEDDKNMNTQSQEKPKKVDPFKVALEEADLIGVATITSVGAPPPRYSDSFALGLQQVKLKLDQVLRGNLKAGSELEAGYIVAKNSPTADPAQPKLNATLFQPGKQVVIFLRKVGDGWQSFDEVYGAMPIEKLKDVKQQLGS